MELMVSDGLWILMGVNRGYQIGIGTLQSKMVGSCSRRILGDDLDGLVHVHRYGSCLSELSGHDRHDGPLVSGLLRGETNI